MKEKCLSLVELAALVEGEIVGDDKVEISGFAPLETAGRGDVSFLVKAELADVLTDFQGSAVIVPLAVESAPVPLIRVKDPYLASARIHTLLLGKTFLNKGIHERAWVGKETNIPKEITVAPLATVGERVKLGERVTIESGVVVGDDVEIGDDTTLKANVTVADGCKIGRRVTIHSGTVIGSDGYGYATDSRGFHVKRPQVGIVRIDDDVEIGANCCVDRAAYGVTWIKSGSKIDNLVQVAHNVVVGENCLLVAQVGIAGSTTLGRNVVLGGQVGVTGHIELGNGVMVAAQSGVHNNQKDGARIGGSPAIPMKQFVRAATQFSRLAEMGRDLKNVKKAVAELTSQEKEIVSGDKK